MRLQNWRRDSGSTPPVGSSRKTIGGSWRMAQPSARRCRQPPARSAARVCSRPREAGHLEDERAARVEPRALEAVDAAEEPDVLIDGQPLVEREALRHVADAPLDAFRIAADVDAADRRRAARRLEQPAQHADRRRLAGAVAAEEAEDLALARRRTSARSTATKSPKRRVRSVTVMAFIGRAPAPAARPRGARSRSPACDRARPAAARPARRARRCWSRRRRRTARRPRGAPRSALRTASSAASIAARLDSTSLSRCRISSASTRSNSASRACSRARERRGFARPRCACGRRRRAASSR